MIFAARLTMLCLVGRYYFVFVFQLILVAICVLVGMRKVKRVKAPERTISTSKDTVAYLQHNIHRR